MHATCSLLGKVNDSLPFDSFYDHEDNYYLVYGSANIVLVVCGNSLVQAIPVGGDGDEVHDRPESLITTLCVNKPDYHIAVSQGSRVTVLSASFQRTIPQWVPSCSFDVGNCDVVSLQFVLDGIMVGVGCCLELWRPRGGVWRMVDQKRLAKPVSRLSVSPSSPVRAVTASEADPVPKLWRVEEGRLLFSQYLPHPKCVTGIWWSRAHQRGNLIYTTDTDGCVRVWTQASDSSLISPFIIKAGLDLPTLMMESTKTSSIGPIRRMLLTIPSPLLMAPSLAVSREAGEVDTAPPSVQSPPADSNSKPLKQCSPLSRKSRHPHSFLNLAQLRSVADQEVHHQPTQGLQQQQYPNPSLNPRKFRAPASHIRSRSTIQRRNVDSSAETAALDWFYAWLHDGSVLLWRFYLVQGDLSVPKFRQAQLTAKAPAVTGATPIPSNEVLFSAGAALGNKDMRFILADTESRILEYAVKFSGDFDSISLSLPPPRPSLVGVHDGHRSAIQHTSVNPFGCEMASHDAQGVLLVWENAEGSGAYVSRKVAVKRGRIQNISWAPSATEFVGSTDSDIQRYRPCKDSGTWEPIPGGLSNVGPYDMALTFSLDNSGKSGRHGHQNEYYIATFHRHTMSYRTWKVNPHLPTAQYLGMCRLHSQHRFDVTSRVMPVAPPFSSPENVLVTYDAERGEMGVWGLKSGDPTQWHCAKRHKMPTANIKMVRYNSVDKAAAVIVGRDGKEQIAIWGFSPLSSNSLYFPESMIDPPPGTSGRVCEMRWHLTPGAQCYLGVQWNNRIDIYVQSRRLYSAWECVHSICAQDFSPPHEFGSFSFSNTGLPIFSVGPQIFESEVRLPSGHSLDDLAFLRHGQMPYICPEMLCKLVLWGRQNSAKKILLGLYDRVKGRDSGASQPIYSPLVPLEEILDPALLDSSVGHAGQKYQGLFDDTDGGSGVLSVGHGDRFDKLKADFLVDQLPQVSLYGVSNVGQIQLMSVVETIALGSQEDKSIDEMGLRYLIMMNLYEYEKRRSPGRSTPHLCYRDINWALNSDTQIALIQHCRSIHPGRGLDWHAFRSMGLAMWIRSRSMLLQEIERLARDIYSLNDRDPSSCGMFFLALKKPRVLFGLWKMAHGHPEQAKMVRFLSNDFSLPRWKTAANKNAFALLGKARYWDAITFFLLGDRLEDAALVCLIQLDDIQLAIALCRCHEGDNGPVLGQLLQRRLIPQCVEKHERWLFSLLMTLRGKSEMALRALTDSLPKLAYELGVETRQPTLSLHETDTELLILHQYILSANPQLRPDLSNISQLIAHTVTLFECLGQPVMALVAISWWKQQCSRISQSSAFAETNRRCQDTMQQPTSEAIGPATSRAPSSTDALMSGMLDMSSWGLNGVGAPGAAASHAGGSSMNSSSSSNSSSSAAVATGHQDAKTESGNMGKDADGAVQDLPLRHNSRVTLAKQVLEYLKHNIENYDDSREGFTKDRETVLKTLGLSGHILVE